VRRPEIPLLKPKTVDNLYFLCYYLSIDRRQAYISCNKQIIKKENNVDYLGTFECAIRGCTSHKRKTINTTSQSFYDCICNPVALAAYHSGSAHNTRHYFKSISFGFTFLAAPTARERWLLPTELIPVPASGKA
jgi:hypothetical protein